MTLSLYKKAKRLIVINDILRYAALAICAYLLLLPYIPQIQYIVEGKEAEVVNVNAVPASIDHALKNGLNYLSVPSMGIDEEIIEATDIRQVHEKVWRRPNASAPGEGSNTVLVAHRYATIGGNRASTFYHLPKMVAGDMIYVAWEGGLYTYRVSSTETVLPTEVRVEDPTPTSQLTLYTCTPLWTATHRFVVHADLVQ